MITTNQAILVFWDLVTRILRILEIYHIRDISWRNDNITLETFCYQLFDKKSGIYLGWYPEKPENVTYQYSIWGIRVNTSVDEDIKNLSAIKMRSLSRNILNEPYVVVNYSMNNPAPIELIIYNSLGQKVANLHREFWSDQEQTISISMNGMPTGIYYAVLRSKNAVATSKFNLIQ